MLTTWHVLGGRQFGGADRFYVRLIRALNETGTHRAVAVNRGERSRVAPALSGQDEQIHLPFANKFDFYTRWALTWAIRRHEPDIVQTYMGRATRLTRVPRRSRGVHVARLGGYYKIRGYYEHAHAWVGNTRGICDYLIRSGLSADRVYCIGNFVPDHGGKLPIETANTLRHRWRIPDSAWVVFSLGRFISKKGFDDLLRAFSILPHEIHGRPVYLIVAGDGPDQDKLTRLGQELGLDSRLRWLGWHDDPIPFFGLSDVMVCPSRHEPLGNVILEAWSHRLPVVSTRTYGAQELIVDNENGLLVDIASPATLAGSLRALLEADLAERARLASNGYETVRAEHSRKAVVRAYLELYRQLTGTS